MLLKKKTSAPCCPGSERHAGPKHSDARPDAASAERSVQIEFLYLDRTVCTRCKGTEDTLDNALSVVTHVLEEAGYRVVVHKVHVRTEALARQHRFLSSPTIRVNGRDIAMTVEESVCESCGDLCGDTVDCREWTWQGRAYTQPPRAMVIDGILRAVYGPPDDEASGQTYVLPENLKRFYDSLRRKRKIDQADKRTGKGMEEAT